VIGRRFALDAAVNPDFSQIESDEPQITVNRRFEVFFKERRPFFLENADFFSTPVNLFFSRRIVEPRSDFGSPQAGALHHRHADCRRRVTRKGRPARRSAVRVAGEARRRESEPRSSRSATAGVLLADREYEGGHNRVEAWTRASG